MGLASAGVYGLDSPHRASTAYWEVDRRIPDDGLVGEGHRRFIEVDERLVGRTQRRNADAARWHIVRRDVTSGTPVICGPGGRLAQTLGEKADDPHRKQVRTRQLFRHLLFGEGGANDILAGYSRCRAGLIVDKRHFAKKIAGRKSVDDFLAAAPGHQDIDRSRLDQISAVAGIALAEDNSILGKNGVAGVFKSLHRDRPHVIK